MQGGHATALVLPLVLLSISRQVLAEHGDSQATLEEAFTGGIGPELARGASLDVQHYGRTLILTGELKEPEDVGSLELVCMLCTSTEAARAAQTLGAMLAEKTVDVESRRSIDLTTQRNPDPSGRPLWVPTVITGLGVAAAAAGAALLLLNGDCASTRIDSESHCAQVHDLGPAGWSLTAAGGVAAITGIVLFFLFSNNESSSEDLP